MRHEFTTAQGQRLGLVSHRSGRRDLLGYAADELATNLRRHAPSRPGTSS